MKVSITQPAYLPWLGYFQRIAWSGKHIVLDHVQIDKSSKTKFANRNKVRTKEGWCWLTVPIKTKGRSGELPLNRIEIENDSGWAQKHWNTLRINYARAPFFADHAPFFQDVYARPWSRLIDLNRELTHYLLAAFQIHTPLLQSSEMGVTGGKDNLILNLCQAAGATEYVSGPFGRDYLDAEAFAAAGLALYFHDYQHPIYSQVFEGFEPYLSAVDLLFNCGPGSREVLLADRTASFS